MSEAVYEYRHIVSFIETNLVGNVYYANHIAWQGKCREMFLHQYAPQVLAQLKQGLSLVTTRTSCEYFAELFAFDEVLIKMRLSDINRNKITMNFEYWRTNPKTKAVLIAKGEQQIACMVHNQGQLQPTPIPNDLKAALSRIKALPE